MRTIKLSLKTIKRAVARAHAISDDWQAECCEIAMIPAVAKRWAELNRDRLPRVHLSRHDGRPRVGMTRDDNLAVKDWTEFAGYSLRYSDDPHYGWNLVRTEWYSHSPSCAWDGMRRETISQFLHDLRTLAHGYDDPEIRRSIERAKIRVA